MKSLPDESDLSARVLVNLVIWSGVDDQSVSDQCGVVGLYWNSHDGAGVGGIYVLLDLERQVH